MAPKDIWNKLTSLYGDTSDDAKQSAWQQFYEFRIDNGEPIAMQLEKFENICKKLENTNDKLSDSCVMTKLLSSLPSRFSAFTMAWECTPSAERKKENLVTRIIREDKRLSHAEDEMSSLALQVQILQMKIKQNESEKSTDKKKESSAKDIEKLKKKTKCHYCGEMGHWLRECKTRIADEKSGKKKGLGKDCSAPSSIE